MKSIRFLSAAFAAMLVTVNAAAALPQPAAALAWHAEFPNDVTKVAYTNGYQIENTSTTSSVWVGAGAGVLALGTSVSQSFTIVMDNSQDGQTTTCDVNLLNTFNGSVMTYSGSYGPNGGLHSLVITTGPLPSSFVNHVISYNVECLLPPVAAAPPHIIFAAY